jgi:hypothetical protein
MTFTLAKMRLTAAESFWYVLQCIAFGAGYFAKVPVKKALSEVGLARLTGAEHFWYVLQCVAFGSGYFAKVPVKKALSEMAQVPVSGYDRLGSGYSAAHQLGQTYQPEVRQVGQPDAGPAIAPPAHRHARGEGRDQQG